MDNAERLGSSRVGQDVQRDTEHSSSQRQEDTAAERKTHPDPEPEPSGGSSSGSAAGSAAGSTAGSDQAAQTRKALMSQLLSHTPARRTQSEGHSWSSMAAVARPQSAIPEVFLDATVNDRLWIKLEPGAHRDSMSSSSSISSSDTVIDLSLPNLARKRMNSLPAAGGVRDPPWAGCRQSFLPPRHAMQVAKSKSNPNLQQSQLRDELTPRPLRASPRPPEDPAGRLTQRRHTWSRLYMEELRQSLTRKPAAAAPGSMSKSLGDLTSDDISCNFDSKYRSISRSFIQRPSREALRRGGGGGARGSQPASSLTEQLRRLADVEPLTASDFSPPDRAQDEALVRRTSSRSQSRVRHIANRAKKAQERRRLQELVQGGGGGGGPMEERGNPEGACSVARSPCSSLDLLSQLAPPHPDHSQLLCALKPS